jgi:hypothetical protein
VKRSGELHTGFEIFLLGGDRRCAEMSTEQFDVYSPSHPLLASDQRFRVRPRCQRRLAPDIPPTHARGSRGFRYK